MPKSWAPAMKAGKRRAANLNMSAKEALMSCFELLQQYDGDSPPPYHFVEWAKSNPTEFYKLWANKCIPQEVAGEGGGPVLIQLKEL